jgi:serine/threonine-protein kinase RsbT
VIVRISHEADLVIARRTVRDLGRQQGMPETAVEALATAVTELARNIVDHARRGEIFIRAEITGMKRGVTVTASDKGPGIADIEAAMTDGYSTREGLGFGLPSARRLVDEFEIESVVGGGTTVTLRKWA